MVSPKGTRPMKTYQKGEKITIKPEWCEEGENDFPCHVLEDRGDRLLVVHECGMSINPTEVILKDCIN
jgi:hypothetical protein